MPNYSLRKISSWFRATLGKDLTVTPEGELVLRPANLFPSSELNGVEGNGRPAGLYLPSLPQRTGRYLYVSEAGNKTASDLPPAPSTLARQNTAQVPTDQTAVLFNSGRIDGPSPIRNPGFSNGLPGPDAPRVEVIDNANEGFPADTWYLSTAGIDRRGKFTNPSEETAFNLANGQGFKAFLQGPYSEGTHKIAILLRKSGHRKRYVQRRVPAAKSGIRKEYVFRDSLKTDSVAPETNNTKVGRPRPPVEGVHVKQEPSFYDLLPGLYRVFYSIEQPGIGESLGSVLSEKIFIPERVPNTALRCYPVNLRPGERFVVRYEKNGVRYRVAERRRTGPVKGFGKSRDPEEGNGVPIHGFDSENTPPGAAHVAIQEDEPQEDTTGIEWDSQAPDPPLPIGQGSPEAGDYLIGLTDVTEDAGRERESVIGALTSVTLNGSQTARVVMPTPVNLIPNAEGSERDRNGRPRGYQIQASATAAEWSAENPGYFGLFATSTLPDSAQAPRVGYPETEINTEEVYTAGGSVTVGQHIGGNAVLYLQELDENMGHLRFTELGRVSENGYIKTSRTFGPPELGGEVAFLNGTAYVRPYGSLEGTSRNLYASFSDIALVEGREIPRKVQKGAEGELDSFDVPPSAPHHPGSFFAIGYPSTPGGAEIEGEPPIKVVGFESGTLEGGTVITSEFGGSVSVIEDETLHENWLLEVMDVGSGSGQNWGYAQYTVNEWADRFAARTLIYLKQMPVHNYIHIFRIAFGDDTRCLILQLWPNGKAFMRICDRNGKILENQQVAQGLSVGDVLDVELAGSGVNTPNGSATCGLGINGEPRSQVAARTGIDWTNRNIRLVQPGLYYERNPRDTTHLLYDQIAITYRGDVLDREQPSAPAGVTPPPPDRAPVVQSDGTIIPGEYRSAKKGSPEVRLGQLYAHILDGPITFTIVGKETLPIIVKPGATYTLALQVRVTLKDIDSTPGEVAVWLHGDGMEAHRAGSLQLSDGGWTGVDRYNASIAIPEGYTEAHIVCEDLPNGIYVVQELFFDEGSFTSQYSRDTRRAELRATGSIQGSADGDFSLVLDTYPDGHELAIPSFGGEIWRRALIEQTNPELPAGVGIENASYATSDNPETFPAAASNPDALTPARYIEFSGSFVGDGIETPRIPLTGTRLETVSNLGVLLDSRRMHLPGIAITGELSPDYSRPQYSVEEVGGRVYATPETEAIDRIGKTVIAVSTEDAYRMLMQTSPNDEWHLENRHADNGNGAVYRVRFTDLLDVDPKDLPSHIQAGHRRVYAAFEVGGFELLESAPLNLPFGNARVNTPGYEGVYGT